ncbi:hypothetical protein Scep_027539 [Stephania cephalantha]|uniref:Uncharacterized protein n=1 Tax=Stephania cephalantha TaxID=152367 RepID=A0AAP0ECR0_9MAGN
MSSTVHMVDEEPRTKSLMEELLKYMKVGETLCEASQPTLSWLDCMQISEFPDLVMHLQ